MTEFPSSTPENKEKGQTSRFDLRQNRLKQFGKLLDDKTRHYRMCLQAQEEDEVTFTPPGTQRSVTMTYEKLLKTYRNDLKTIFRNVKHYAGTESKDTVNQIKNQLQKASNLMNASNKSMVLETLEKAEDNIMALRQEAGLDLPMETEPEEGKELLD